MFVAGPDVGDTQIRETIYPVQIRRCFKKDLWLVGSRATAAIENDPSVSQLDVAGTAWLDHLPTKNSDIEVLRLVLVAHGEEMRAKKPSRAIGASGAFMRRLLLSIN